MSLEAVVAALGANKVLENDMSVRAWQADQEMRAEKVALFRDYVEGNHRADLTDEMRSQLRIKNKSGDSRHTDTLNEFNANHCDVIIQTMVDRLHVTQIDADNDKARKWVENLLTVNRFDALQGDVHQATCRDGDTFLLEEWDNKKGQVRWYHEPAYDGLSGMLVIYSSPGEIGAAVKIWRTTTTNMADSVRVNIYYPDKIEKYISRGGGGLSLEKYEVEGEEWPAPWVDKKGDPLGVPVIHYRNRGVEYTDFGQSEIENVIPLQDVLNRILYSMVMTAENTAFPMRLLVGTVPPAGLTPGMFIKVYVKDDKGNVTEPSPDQVAWFNAVRLETTKQGELQPFIDQAKWTQAQMYDISGTPLPATGNDAESGESQKQREIKLLGKARRFQVKIGNAWEDAVALAWRIEAAYGSGDAPPAYTSFKAKWLKAEMRDDRLIIETVDKFHDLLGDEESLRVLGQILDYDEAKIKAIMAANKQARQDRAQIAASTMPGFGNFRLPNGVGENNPNPEAVPVPTNN